MKHEKVFSSSKLRVHLQPYIPYIRIVKKKEQKINK